MRELAALVLEADQFERLKEVCRYDEAFPSSLSAWRVAVSEARAEAQRYGELPLPVGLDPQHFKKWCEKVSVQPCLDALRAYVIVRQRRPGTSKFGQERLDSDWMDLD